MLPLRESLMVGVWAGRGTWSRGGSMDGGGAGGHPRAQLARLETPQQFLISATQTLLLVALLLHVHLQVGVLLRELPEKEEGRREKSQNINTKYYCAALCGKGFHKRVLFYSKMMNFGCRIQDFKILILLMC